jgi:hypothetical protein
MKKLLSNAGIFPFILSALFLVLKFLSVVSWGWLWVLSPIWLYVAMMLLIAGISAIWVAIWVKKRK